MDGGPFPDQAAAHPLATPQDVLERAEQYAEAADFLFKGKTDAEVALHVPARLCALQAIELYLHAFLRFRGVSVKQIKARQHNVWHEEFCQRLELDKRTREHLQRISKDRVYVAVRYPGEVSTRLCEPTRVERTLRAIRDKSDRIPFHA
jgi:hypothetical protein